MQTNVHFQKILMAIIIKNICQKLADILLDMDLYKLLKSEILAHANKMTVFNFLRLEGFSLKP